MTNWFTIGQRGACCVKSAVRVMPLMWLVFVSSCSGGVHISAQPRARGRYISRPALGGHVSLAPSLLSGTAGWCMATFSRRPRGGSSASSTSGCEEVPGTSAGPVLAETCPISGRITTLYVLTRSDVAAVVVDDGKAIPTTGGSSLAEGLRAAVVEVIGPVLPFRERLERKQLCPAVTSLNRASQPIGQSGVRNKPLIVNLPRKEWKHPTRESRGACRLATRRLPAETMVLDGSVATRIRAVQGLIGNALLSCVDTRYLYRGEHDLTAAVLLDASHPGVTPPPLPAMKPAAGHPGIFEAPGSSGNIAVRRIPGAWLAVEEADEVGLRVPIELLEQLQATVHL